MSQPDLELAKQHHQAGRLAEAERLYRQVLAQQPNDSDALNLLAVAVFQAGRGSEAMDLIHRAIALRPQRADYLYHLGLIHAGLGQSQPAIEAYQGALEIQPDLPEAHFNLAMLLRERRQWEAAGEAFRRAIALRPQWPEALQYLGGALHALGRCDQAITALRRAVVLRPDYAEAWNDLGSALHTKGCFDEAIAAYRRALAVRPHYAEVFYNLALTFRAQGRLTAAIGALRRAVKIRPDFAEAHNNLGNALKNVGRLEEAVESYQRAVTLWPTYAEAHSNLLLLLHYCPRYDAAAILQQMRGWDQQHAQPLRACIQPHANDPSPQRRLRIGYVSPDFCGHIVGLNLLPLFREHDHQSLEVFCYANLSGSDPFTEYFRKYCDGWRCIAAVDDPRAAQMIRDDKIDLLVDLAGHTANNRLPLFARKPAPIQVTFGGYPGGTGLSTMDYHLTDPYLDPPGMTESHYVERLLRLPDSFWCYDPEVMHAAPDPEVSALPALMTGAITFGCLSNFCKVNDPTLQLWAKVLAAMPASQLLLMVPPGPPRHHVANVLAEHGVAPQRVEFVGYQSRDLYLQTYHRIDLGLDTLPYNGHTTSLDAMWMGVPVITLVGSTAVGRAGFSQLSNLGLQALVANTEDQFVRIATTLANDLPSLVELRASMRQRIRQSPLTDAKRFARNVESAYRQMWLRWCQSS